jgi:hypothetical protein
MSNGDFEAELKASVQDHLALIATAAKAAKVQITAGVTRLAPAAAAEPAPIREPAAFQDPTPSSRSIVNFDAPEPDFDPAFSSAFATEADAFAEEPAPLPPPEPAFDDFSNMGNVDDEGIPVWEDPP